MSLFFFTQTLKVWGGYLFNGFERWCSILFCMTCRHICTTRFRLYYNSSEIRGLRSTKCSSETLQNLLYFMYKKTHVVFFVFHFVQFYIFTLWMPWSMSTTYSKFWSVSLEHFVECKPLISEECICYFMNKTII